MKALLTSLATGLALWLTPSCVGPSAIDSQGNVVGPGASSSLQQRGLKEWASIKSKKRRSSNASYQAAVNRVGQRLTRVVPSAGARWEFVVFDDPTPNAFALPGGKVGVHSGLFPITKNDAGLATVLAHEMAHVTANHSGSRVRQQQGLAVGGALLGAVLGNSDMSSADRAKLLGVYGAGATVGVALPFSRRQELEADRVGMIYMAKAGYDPAEALNLWRRFGAYNKRQGRSTPEWLRTHPLDSTRLQALQTSLPQAQRFYR